MAKKEEKKGKMSMGIDCTSKTKCKKNAAAFNRIIWKNTVVFLCG